LVGALSQSKSDYTTSASEEDNVASGVQDGTQSTDNELIYLSSESPYTLHTLSPNTSYIIGGLVDRNRHKGICYKKACDLGLKTAKLPIGEYLNMASRKVLATNHVVEIMIAWFETGDWGESFLRVMPARKGGVLKGSSAPETPAEEEDEDQAEDEDLDNNDLEESTSTNDERLPAEVIVQPA
jgi:tRNA (guanine9-N1)-methyltransferase